MAASVHEKRDVGKAATRQKSERFFKAVGHSFGNMSVALRTNSN